MRQLARVHEFRAEGDSVGVAPATVAEDVITFHVGAVGDWYYRELRANNTRGESFVTALQRSFTAAEATALFRDLQECRCCARHLLSRPTHLRSRRVAS